jgi:hypothetical protein
MTLQIKIEHACRECGSISKMTTDTSSYEWHSLRCEECSHVSGQVKIEYLYRAEDRPRHERERR